MNERYFEERVKQKLTGKTMAKAFGMMLSAVVVLFLAFIFSYKIPILFMLAIPYAAYAVYFVSQCNYEYEYLYFQGSLDIDRIRAKSSRKRIITVDVKEMEVMAPSNSATLQQYNNLKRIDCSSNTGAKTYELVAKRKGQLVRIIFEPSQKLVDNIRVYAPRKVFYY